MASDEHARRASAWGEWDRLISNPDVDALEVLAAVARYGQYLDAVEREAIRAARAGGRSWEEIAQSMGVSRQAVWQRGRRYVVQSALEHMQRLKQDPKAFGAWLSKGTADLTAEPPPRLG